MSAAANPTVSSSRNCAPAKADSSVNTASERTRPSGSIITPNRHTAAATIARYDVKACNRLTAQHERAGDEYRSQGRKQAAKQQRKIARSHFAGRARGISARGEDGDHGKAAEHHARPEILRRADSHASPSRRVRCHRHRTIKSASGSSVNGAHRAPPSAHNLDRPRAIIYIATLPRRRME